MKKQVDASSYTTPRDTTKRLHAGRAAQAGVVAAELAAKGFVGIDGIFEAAYGGYCATLSEDPKPYLIADGLWERFETENVGFKIYACCGSCHTPVEAVRKLREAHGITPDMVRSIDVHTTQATYLHVGWSYEPRSITAAQMNGPYCVAATMLDGDAFVEQFGGDRIKDPVLTDLARRVRFISDPALDSLGPSGRHHIRMRVHLEDGRTLEQEVGHAKGSEADPLSGSEVVDKFRRLASPIAGEAWADEVFEHAMSLERQSDLAHLSKLLARPFAV